MMRRNAASLLIAIVGLLASACSGSSGAEPLTGSTLEAPPATTLTPPPTDPPATDPPNITADTTTAPPTTARTVPETTTSISEDEIKAEVEAAVGANLDSYLACVRAPSDCDPVEFLPPGSRALSALQATIEEMISFGSFAGPEATSEPVVREIMLDQGQAMASVRWCLYDTSVLYGPSGDDGDPLPIANTPTSFEFNSDYVVVDSKWLLDGETVESRTPEINTCTD